MNHTHSHRPAWLVASFWVLVFISIAVVVRRLIALAHPATGTSPMASLDGAFSSHAVLTIFHIVPAALFVVVSVPILLRRTRADWLKWQFFIFGAITGITAYAMNAYAIGGWTERSAVLVFDTWFLISLARSFWFFLHDESGRERIWAVRAVGILLGIATTRPVMGVFFATSRLTHLAPNQFFGVAFWIGFSLNAVAVELWLRSRRSELQ